MALTASEKNLGVVAGCLGILQGLAWITMSIICILEYLRDTPFTSTPTSWMDKLQRALFSRFLYKETQDDSSVIVTPNIFTIFMWIYLCSHLLWVAVSILQLIADISNNLPSVRHIFKGWGSVTILILLIDLSFAVLLGTDFDSCLNDNDFIIDIEGSHQEQCSDVYLLVIVLVERGFILEIVNLILACLVLKFGFSKDADKDDWKYLASPASTDDRFKSTLPRATLTPSPQPPALNNDFPNYGNPNPPDGYDMYPSLEAKNGFWAQFIKR